jgi:RNA polymerase sigma factor (sigma-70 family)
MSDTILDLPALKRGDELAWNHAFNSLYRHAYRAALTPRAQLSPEEAQEVAIDALTKLVPRIEAVATQQELIGLLVTISYRQAISAARRRSALKRPQRAGRLERAAQDDQEVSVVEGARPTSLSPTEQRELVGLLHQILQGVDPTTRELLIRHHLEGSTFAELSVKLGLPLGTVSVKIARGLEQIRKGLKRSSTLLKELRDYLR